jgi:hypothetical protein
MKKIKSRSGPRPPSWWEAVMVADEYNDPTQLMTMLLPSAPPLAREMITELLSRKRLLLRRIKPGGRQRSPYADLTDEQTNVITAALEFEERGQRKSESYNNALKRLVRRYFSCLNKQDVERHVQQIDNWLNSSGSVYIQYGHLVCAYGEHIKEWNAHQFYQRRRLS